MIDVVLYRPEIPPNTGNVIRLCANTGAKLNLIHPLGFEWDDTRVKRAGLDYHELANVMHHQSWLAYREFFNADNQSHQTTSTHMPPKAPRRLIAVETGGTVQLDQFQFREDDVLIFGQETAGLPTEVMHDIPAAHRVTLPMRPGNRSLNLSNAVAVAVFEAWRQLGYPGSVLR
jgi:tRNA (cytidine/uridine-2'-O-)-methyltransferase